MKLIERNEYMDKLINVIGTPDIKVITDEKQPLFQWSRTSRLTQITITLLKLYH